MFWKKKKPEPAFNPIEHIRAAISKASALMPPHQIATLLQDLAQHYEIASAVGVGSRAPWTNGIPPLQHFHQEKQKYNGLADIIRGGPRR